MKYWRNLLEKFRVQYPKTSFNKAWTNAGTSCNSGVSNNGVFGLGIAIMVFLPPSLPLSLSLSLPLSPPADNRSARSSVRILIMFLVRAEVRKCSEEMRTMHEAQCPPRTFDQMPWIFGPQHGVASVLGKYDFAPQIFSSIFRELENCKFRWNGLLLRLRYFVSTRTSILNFNNVNQFTPNFRISSLEEMLD